MQQASQLSLPVAISSLVGSGRWDDSQVGLACRHMLSSADAIGIHPHTIHSTSTISTWA